jgi:hypothetical protein
VISAYIGLIERALGPPCRVLHGEKVRRDGASIRSAPVRKPPGAFTRGVASQRRVRALSQWWRLSKCLTVRSVGRKWSGERYFMEFFASESQRRCTRGRVRTMVGLSGSLTLAFWQESAKWPPACLGIEARQAQSHHERGRTENA